MSKNRAKKIILTGGHAATTAIATVEEILRRTSDGSSWEIYWVGAKTAFEGKKIPTLESSYLPKKGVIFHPIVAGRLQRKFTLWTIPSAIRIPFGFIHAFFILNKIKPDIILSFGGYASFPVVVMGKLLNIPSVLHEQTMVVGRANKVSSFFVDKIALARPESRAYLIKGKCVVVGNPVMTQIADVEAKSQVGDPPTIYIAGGSRGAQTLNSVVIKILPRLLKKYSVIHVAGQLDYKRCSIVKNKIDKGVRERYQLYSVVDPMQVDNMYRASDLVISRAGANTISEIIVTQRPAIVIPLPFAYKNEQLMNAYYAKKTGLVEIIRQESLSSDLLLSKIEYNFENWEKIIKSFKKPKIDDRRASQRLVDLLETLV